MARSLANVISLFASMALLILGNGLLGVLLSVRLELEAFSTASIAVVLGVYSFGFIAGTVLLEPVIQRVGHIRSFAAFAALYCAAILAFPLWVSVTGWVLLRLVTGFCLAGLTLVMESWLNGRATVENRGRLLSVYMVVFFLAAASGQMLLQSADPAGHILFSLAAIVVALAVLPLSLTRSAAPTIAPTPRIRLRELARIAPLGVVTAFVAGVITSAFSGAGPIYALRIGLEPEAVAVFMATPLIASMLVQPVLGWISDRLPRALVLALTVVVTTAAAVAVIVTGRALFTLLVAAVSVHVALASVLYPMSLAITHDSLDSTRVIPANATLLLALGLGTVIGPVAAPVAMARFGPEGLFLFIGGVLAAEVVLMLFLRQRRVPVEEQAHGVVTVPQVLTPLAVELDPRAEPEEFESIHHPIREPLVERRKE